MQNHTCAVDVKINTMPKICRSTSGGFKLSMYVPMGTNMHMLHNIKERNTETKGVSIRIRQSAQNALFKST